MFQIVIGIGVVLVLLILLMMFRIGALLNVAKGSDKKIATGSNKINAGMFMVLLIGGFGWMFWYSIVYFDDYNLPLASEHGVVTDHLFWVTMVITGLVFVITHILLFAFPAKYYYKEGRTAMFYPENYKLELLWTIVPAIVLSVLVFTGLQAWNDITSKAPEEAEQIEIFGQQFAWVSRYTGADDKLGNFNYRKISIDNKVGVDFTDEKALDDFIPREIHLPKGHPVLFKIRARDVLHSVYAPHFRLKMDAVPGMPTQFHFVATKTTAEMREETGNPDFNYELACAEVCGRGHFAMRLLIVVDTKEDYDKWKSEQKTLLAQSEELMELVPANMKELAKIKAGIEDTPATEESSDNVEVQEASL